MSAAWLWIGLDLRKRARSLLVLALLVLVTTAVVLTAVAGSRRGASALDRLLDRTKPATIAVLPNEPGFDWDAIKAIDDVEAVGQFPVSAYTVDGLPFDGPANFAYDAQVMHALETPVVLEGRVADPARDDELVITKAFEGAFGKGVGDHLTVRLYSPEQIDESALSNTDPGEPEGPAIDSEIVGVVRSPWFSDSGDSESGTVVPSPGLLDQHRANLVGTQGGVYLNALVRLEDGAAGIASFRDELAKVSGRTDIEFFNLAEQAEHVRSVARFEADALLAFAAAAAIAALFLVGQSVVRSVASATADLEVLRAIGMPPRHIRWMAAAGPTLAAIVGGAAGVGVAILVSSRFPTGTAEPFEPSPGVRVDGAVLVIGYVLVVALVAGGALVASWVAARSFGRFRAARPSRLASLATKAGAPVPAAIGARFALERGSGPQSVPVLPALIGSVVGVLGIVAALTFADGIDDATSNPERFGMFAELESFFGLNGEDFVPSDDVVEQIATDPDVQSVNDDRNAVAEVGSVDLSLFTIDPVDDAPPVVMIEGNLPPGDGQVALAPTTADDIGVGVGDTIEMVGGKATVEMTVTGLAFVPEGPHNEYDAGAWITPGAFDALNDSFKFHFADIALRDGADVEAVAARINTTVAAALDAPEGTEVVGERVPPSRLGELKELGRLPMYLAAFLGLLAITAIGHAVATAVRRRRHDLAVLRAIGLTRWQTRAIALAQASVLALVGVVVGIPLGIALGRSLWSSVADNTPVVFVAPLAAVAVVLITPVALLIANALAAWPSQRAASLRVGQVLRTE
jgi:ABC-type lipoprotein release transport system permease subunit